MGFLTVAPGYTYKDVGVSGNAICPWMDGIRATHRYMDVTYQGNAGAVTERRLV